MMTFHRVAFAGVVVALDSLAAAAEDSAPPGNAALLAFAWEPLTFDPFVFTGPTFPCGKFDHPERVTKLIGPYSLQPTFYDEHGKVVSAPGKAAGRYAAVVEIR